VFWLIISSAAGCLRADVDYLPGPTAPLTGGIFG
jgi:hypothetical protein